MGWMWIDRSSPLNGYPLRCFHLLTTKNQTILDVVHLFPSHSSPDFQDCDPGNIFLCISDLPLHVALLDLIWFSTTISNDYKSKRLEGFYIILMVVLNAPYLCVRLLRKICIISSSSTVILMEPSDHTSP